MGGQRGSEGVQRDGCGALANLANHVTDNKVKIGAGGGVEAIVQAMIGHCWSAGVQWNGGRALLLLAQEADNRIKIGAGGGVKAIVQAMNGHRRSALSWAVQQHCCEGLGNLAVNADNAVKIGAGGGVEAIVQTIGGHRGRKGVQFAGCSALWILGRSNRGILQRIKRAGAEEAVQRAMASPDAFALTKEQGQELLSLLRNV